MENTLSVAKTLYEEYFRRFGEKADQLKMHKLMYFLQRESLMKTKQVLFPEDFYGWKYGPVLKSVRSEYVTGNLFSGAHVSDNKETCALVDSILERYGAMSPWKLSSLSHGEFSWKCARKGLDALDNGDVKLRIEAIKVDAVKEQAERDLFQEL